MAETASKLTGTDSTQSGPSLAPPTAGGLLSSSRFGDTPPSANVGSPLKKARPSVDFTNSEDKYSSTQSLSAALGSAISGSPDKGSPAPKAEVKLEEEEEEL
jgi:hypothetical protein